MEPKPVWVKDTLSFLRPDNLDQVYSEFLKFFSIFFFLILTKFLNFLAFVGPDNHIVDPGSSSRTYSSDDYFQMK